MMSKIFILSILVLNSCASQKPNNISKKEALDSISIDGDWEVISIHGQKDFSQKPNMSFSQKDQHVGGNSGCNNYGGEFSIKGSDISFGQMTSTMMACIGDNTEDRFFSALDQVKSYSIKDGKLQLIDKNQNIVLELQNPKKQKGVSRIIYRANSRAFFKEIIVSENEVFIKNDRNDKNHTQLKTTKINWKACLRLLSQATIDELPKLKAPTSKRLYDGAAHANLIVEKDGKKITSITFDHGHPPKAIEALVEQLLSISEK